MQFTPSPYRTELLQSEKRKKEENIMPDSEVIAIAKEFESANVRCTVPGFPMYDSTKGVFSASSEASCILRGL